MGRFQECRPLQPDALLRLVQEGSRKSKALSRTGVQTSVPWPISAPVSLLLLLLLSVSHSSFRFAVRSRPREWRPSPLRRLFFNLLVNSYWLPVRVECRVRLRGYWDDQNTVPALLDSVWGGIALSLFTALKQLHLHCTTPYPSALGSLAGMDSCPLLLSPSSCLELKFS